MPEWTQLYQTELAAEGIDFLLNKDLRETFIREVDTEDKLKGTSTLENTGTSSTNGTSSLEEALKAHLDGTNGAEQTLRDVIAGTGSSETAENGTVSNTKTNTLDTTEAGTSTKDTNNTVTSEDNTTKTLTGETATKGKQDTLESGSHSSTENTSDVNDGVASAILEQGYLTRAVGSNGNDNKSTGVTTDNTETSTGSEATVGTKTYTTVLDEEETSNLRRTGTETLAEEGTDIKTGTSTEKKNETLDRTDSRTGTNSEDKTEDITKTGTTTSSTEDNSTQNGATTEDKTGKLLEKTELISKGNIGQTSSAELLEAWRKVIINIDKMIILSCRDLFMLLY